jgi:endonuclease G
MPLITATDEIIRHTGFTLSYCERHEQARWVAYKLSAEQLKGTVTRTNRFMSDPNVAQGSATDADYKHSGFDRGHLAPAADMKWSDEAMRSSFYFSNMSPQKRGFNAGVWKRAEELVRTWANTYQMVYVVTGPVLHDSLQYIGQNKVSVPRLFYKVLLTGDSSRALGFVIPHENSKMHLSQFAVSVDSVERLTGINFFHHLPDDIEQRLENMQEF